MFLHEDPSGETRYQDRWLRGPFGPAQANLDHLLLMRPSQRWNLAKNLFERQNELYRQEHKTASSSRRAAPGPAGNST